MFQFFNKKKFLVDYLDGFIDIHNHILPGIDDGAKNVDDSIALIKAFSELGVNHFIATPHIMSNYYPNTKDTINSSLTALKNALLQNDLKDIALVASAEHMIDDNFEYLLENAGVMPMKKDYLLVEMSYLQPPINFDEAIVKTASKRFFPVLAHPERYGFLHHRKKRYQEYKNNGILFQMNLLSLSEYYGKEVPKVALELLDNGLIDFVASDVHNMNQLEALKKLTLSKKMVEQLLPLINNTIQTFY
ncbi:histidinol phosphatase [Zobellia amurskyensis]|uniref:protein-tyrosine-phosphatase n=1 Tax=Zobellia amurskyensis TaxID=248905 RepID=A0A7X2ZUD0_9FLAO|nr:CpsB/CapC family capsule biosynthesis tyrosine phosphatase [Zobellia amurskyensis]MUH36578.1 histidinol phosphatase [Zobellia amurskyensis]